MFMNATLDTEIFEDQYYMAVCERFFRDAGMFQHVQALREENKDLEDILKTSQPIVFELQCQVVSAKRSLLEKDYSFPFVIMPFPLLLEFMLGPC
ncbi:hypothetical protein Hdeb2414_s0012g00383841 [Helianthus debilis subsp. tardiflorus]